MSENIVFLDASTVDYGDADLSPLGQFGTFTAYPVTQKDELYSRIHDATIVISNKVIIDRDTLQHAPALKFINLAATGYNNIDIAACKERGIAVANVAGYSTYSVAQLTMSYILAFATKLIEYNTAGHDGTWSCSPIFTVGSWPVFDLQNKTIGIIGMGTIGRAVAGLCTAFGMNIITVARSHPAAHGYKTMPLSELTAASDFISIHTPLTDETKHFINADFLSKMKRSAYLINVARGPVVDPKALCDALNSGTIAGAAIDVMEKEPPDTADPLFKAKNLIITPHVAMGKH